MENRIKIIIALLLTFYTLQAQPPIYGDRDFISSNGNDTLSYTHDSDSSSKFTPDYYLWIERLKADSVLASDGTWYQVTDIGRDTSSAVKFSDGYILKDSSQIVDCDNLHVEISSTNNGVIDCVNAFVTLTGHSNKDVTWAWQGSISGSLGTTSEISAVTPETVTLTVTDPVTGCQNDTNIVLTSDIEQPSTDIFISGTVDSTQKYITANAIVTNPRAGHTYTYEWSDGLKADKITKITASDSYTLTVTDQVNGCTSNEVFTVDIDDYNGLITHIDSIRALSGSDISIDSNAIFQEKTTFQRTEQTWDSIAFSSTINVDFTDGSDYKMVVVTGDITVNVTDLYGGESVLWIIQDGTGSHTVTKGTGWGDLRGSGTISTDADAISVVQWQKAVGPGTYTKVIHWID